jgi:hypothetical protein
MSASTVFPDPTARPQQPKLLERMRDHLRTRHYSIRTETAYVDWVRRFILFHDKRHPADMGSPEVAAFLTHLAVDRQVSASTQNQAKSAIFYLDKEVLLSQLLWLDEVVQTQAPKRLPVVLTPCEVRDLLVLPQTAFRCSSCHSMHDCPTGFCWHLIQPTSPIQVGTRETPKGAIRRHLTRLGRPGHPTAQHPGRRNL